MRYTMVGAVTLGFDLARLDGGAEVAALLRAALALRPDDLGRVAAAHPGHATRRETYAELDRARAGRDALSDLLPLAGSALADVVGGDVTTLRRLEQGMLGDLDGLDHLIRHEILDWTWARAGSTAVQDPEGADAADVLLDAAAAHYLGTRADRSLDPALHGRLGTPLRQAGIDPVEGIGDDGMAPHLRALLSRLAGADAAAVARVRQAVHLDRALVTARWAPAVHRATWAISTAQRLRAAMDVQLACVGAFRRAGLTPADAAYGVWNAMAGGLQAHVVADLLPTDDLELLGRAWTHLLD